MRMILKLCYCICIMLTLPVLTYAKEWRGIIPMRSTRADVEMLLGEPPAPPKDGSRQYTWNKGRSIYFLDEGEVYIIYAEAEIPAAVDCLARIPAGTVLMIQITPKNNLALIDVPIDETKFRKFDPSTPPNIGYAAYINEQEGLIIRTFESRVEQIIYIASAPDKGLCPTYHQNSESLVHVFVCGLAFLNKFDEYGALPWTSEVARLDNFAIPLKSQSGAVGYIIVYASRRARAGEAHARANRAREYLERYRNVDVGRVAAIDGGYREDLSVELFVGTADGGPPAPTPTVQESEVQIVNDHERPHVRRHVKP